MHLATAQVSDSGAGAVFTYVFFVVLFALSGLWFFFARLMRRR